MKGTSFMIRELQDKINILKKEKDVCILAHSYQTADIIDIADITGDSFMLSSAAQKVKNKTLLMCGVRFMAETAKLLSPEKEVILAHPNAACPMAEQISPDEVYEMRKKHPNAVVMAYINTTAELKAVCDVCVTSSSAVKIAENIEANELIFLPDCNLGQFVAEKVPDKVFYFMRGGCPYHASVTEDEVEAARALHLNAKLLVHPECRAEISKSADFVGSTSEIMNYAEKNDCKEFIIGTENSIRELLQYKCPDKKFYELSKKLICPDMKMTTLIDVYNALKGYGGESIVIPDTVARKARNAIDKMLELG